MAEDAGAHGGAVISPESVYTAAWVRLKCRYGCGGYESNLMCPPHSPEPAETREALDCYTTAVLVHVRGSARMRDLVPDLEREAFLAGYYKAFGFASGPCELCAECALDEGCRHPRRARPSMESCGIDVFRTVREAGFPIEVVTDRDQVPNFYGLLLLE